MTTNAANKITEYKTIVHAFGINESDGTFQEEVNDALAHGWSLWGGVSVSLRSDGLMIIAQAVIREKTIA